MAKISQKTHTVHGYSDGKYRIVSKKTSRPVKGLVFDNRDSAWSYLERKRNPISKYTPIWYDDYRGWYTANGIPLGTFKKREATAKVKKLEEKDKPAPKSNAGFLPITGIKKVGKDIFFKTKVKNPGQIKKLAKKVARLFK
jgi:hypothetical protein